MVLGLFGDVADFNLLSPNNLVFISRFKEIFYEKWSHRKFLNVLSLVSVEVHFGIVQNTCIENAKNFDWFKIKSKNKKTKVKKYFYKG